MSLEDRVVSTDVLLGFADDSSGTLAIAAGLLWRLSDPGLHVLVPRGPAPVPGEVLLCEAQLDTGREQATRVPVLVPLEVWRRLPTAYAVVSAATHLIPEVIDTESCELVEAVDDVEE